MTLIVIIVYLNFFPINWEAEENILWNIGTAGYILVDMVLLISLLLLILAAFQGSYKLPWLIICTGAIINLIGDIYYAIYYESYYDGHWLDLLWYYGYLLFGAGFIAIKTNAEKTLGNAAEWKQAKKKKPRPR